MAFRGKGEGGRVIWVGDAWGTAGGGGAAGTVRMVHLRAQSVFIHVIRAI